MITHKLKIGILFIVISSILLLPLVVIFHKSISYYVLKEIVYQEIADKVCLKQKNKEAATIAIVKFVSDIIRTPYGLKIEDTDVLSDLVKGLAYCDQEAWAMATLLGKKNIKARICMLEEHTLLEVLLDNRWIFFEPWSGLYVTKDDLKLATLQDILNKPELLISHPRVLLLRDLDDDSFKKNTEWLKEVLSEARRPRKYLVFRELSNRSAVNLLINNYRSVFGKLFTDTYIDFYFAYNKKSMKPDYSIYYHGRLNHLIGESKKAKQRYESLISNFPESKYLPDTFYFLGRLEMEEKNYDLAIEMFKKFIDFYSSDIRMPYVLFRLWLIYEIMGDSERAKYYKFKTIDTFKGFEDPGSSSLLQMPLTKKIIKP